ncbi:NADPH oxidase 5-like [Lytechinus pictus]|uniref:NADPH oxidase 5-like n=1 Tax=Lytechinus pictus TaxID=7653 RepID=UPI0030B9AFC5
MAETQESDEKWLMKLEKQFQEIAGDDNQIDLDEFINALNVKKSFFAERFFELIDEDQSGSISLNELIGALRLLVNGTEEEKLHFLFRVYDVDGSGFIDFDELKTVLNSCTAESALTLSDETLTELTEILFEDADVDGDGHVSFEELSEQLQRYPSITSNLTISAAEWLNPKKKKLKQQSARKTCCNYHTIRNHLSVIIFWVVFVIINVGLAGWGAYEGHQSIKDDRNPVSLAIARSAGRCLSFSCCFVLILMLRKLLTTLRNTFLTTVLPLDQHVIIHKIVAIFIIILSVVHTAAHIANIGLLYEVEMANGTTTDWVLEVLVRPFPGLGLVEGSCIITGILIIIVLIIMTICSMPFIRRNGYFKVFHWTHQLCIVFWTLIIIHSKYFWIWFIIPGAIYFLERLLRLQVFRRARFGKTYIQIGYILPANVVHLVIQRPSKFKFHAGEYVHVNIPSIASHEWHPFTISSAPEEQDFMSLHIRCVGHWTKRLYGVIKELEHTLPKDMQHLDVDDREQNGNSLDVKVDLGTRNVIHEVDRENQKGIASENKKNLFEENTYSTCKKGATNLGFESEVKDEVKDQGKSSAYNTSENRHAPYQEEESSQGTFKVNGNGFKMKTLQSQESSMSQDVSGQDNSKAHSVLHSLDLSKMLGGTPHTGLEIILDGPYGAPAQHIMEAEHAVLIGAGIGITPFASILQSIYKRYKAAKTQCPKCHHTWMTDTPSILKTKKVDFIWINRDQRSFEWFISLINAIETEQADVEEIERFLDVHLYMTSALSPSDMKAIGLHVALDLIHKKNKRDTITGLMTRTQPGRPNWDEVFQKLEQQRKGKITVFFCGSPALGKVLSTICLRYQMEFRMENF